MAVKTLSEIKKQHILRVLDLTGWDIKKASKILNISPAVMKREIKRTGLERLSRPAK